MNQMFMQLLTVKYFILAAFIATGLFVHLRGRVKHKLFRQLTDHSTIMAPYNTLMYLFSKVPAKPYADVKQFPELSILKDNWELIRDEGLKLYDEGHICAAAKYNNVGFNSFFRTGWKRFYLMWYDDFSLPLKPCVPRPLHCWQISHR